MIKVYYLTSTDYAIGEIDESMHKGDSVMLNYPAAVTMGPVNEEGEIGFRLTPLVAPFLKNFRPLMEQFRLKSDLIVISGEPNDDLVDAYMKFQRNIKIQFTGIVPADQHDIERLGHLGGR